MLKLLNKFAIPTILLAIVMVAGMFAFMPVEQVSTVHTGDLASVAQFKTDSVTCTSTGINDDCLITISSDKDYLVWDISADLSAWDVGDTVQLEDFEIGGINTIAGDNVVHRTFANVQTVPLKTIEFDNCEFLCDEIIPAQGGTDITFELDITVLDDASESIPITVTFLTASDANIDVTSTSIIG